METNGQALVGYLRQQPGRLHVCFEESTWSKWLYEILSPHTTELVVFQTQWQPRTKSDALDAHGLLGRGPARQATGESGSLRRRLPAR